MMGGIPGLTAQPLIKARLQLARSLGQHAISVLRAWIGRRRDWPVVPLPA